MNRYIDIVVIIGIFVILVAVLKFLERIIYQKEINAILGYIPATNKKTKSKKYDMVVRVFRPDGTLLFNRVKNTTRGFKQSDQYAFAYDVGLEEEGIIIFPRRVLTNKSLFIAFDKITSIRYGTRDLGPLQPLEKIGYITSIPELDTKVKKSDYASFLATYITSANKGMELGQNLQGLAGDDKVVYLIIETQHYIFLLNPRYGAGIGPAQS